MAAVTALFETNDSLAPAATRYPKYPTRKVRNRAKGRGPLGRARTAQSTNQQKPNSRQNGKDSRELERYGLHRRFSSGKIHDKYMIGFLDFLISWTEKMSDN
jgi:hypothetical protein